MHYKWYSLLLLKYYLFVYLFLVNFDVQYAPFAHCALYNFLYSRCFFLTLVFALKGLLSILVWILLLIEDYNTGC